MSLLRSGVKAISLVVIVLGLGYFVQNSASTDTRSVRKATQPAASTVYSVTRTTSTTGAAIFGIPRPVGAPDRRPAEIQNAALAIDATLSEVDAPQVSFIAASPMDNCATDLVAVPQFAAMVQISIQSPCHPNADLVVWHEQIVFSIRTDAQGNAVAEVPALLREATFVVTFNNIEEARKTVTVPDAQMFERAVLQWRGTSNLQLHAMEFGATVGDPGHIWSAATHSPDLAHEGERGFMTRLGTSAARIPYWAEVYTYPAGLISRDGQVKLQVGAAVTEENCGRDLDVTGIKNNAGRAMISTRFEVQIPACNMVGTSVMRPELFDALTLATH